MPFSFLSVRPDIDNKGEDMKDLMIQKAKFPFTMGRQTILKTALPFTRRQLSEQSSRMDETYTTQDDLDEVDLASGSISSSPQSSRHTDTDSTIPLEEDGLLPSCLKVKTLQESLSSVSTLRRPMNTRQVHWGKVVIREYAVCLGDNPACSDGAPIQLDWHYKRYKAITVSEFERIRGPPKLERHSSTVRQVWLLQIGYSLQEILAAMDQRAEYQRLRLKTVSRLKFMALDQQVEKFFRKAKIYPFSSKVAAAKVQ